jgi:hypothetical protein
VNTEVVLDIVLSVIVIIAIQTLQSLYYKRYISLLKQENKAAVNKAFGKGWDACVNVTRSCMSEPRTEKTRVSRSLH